MVPKKRTPSKPRKSKPKGRTKSGAPRKRAASTGNWRRHKQPYTRKDGTRVKGYSHGPSGCAFLLLTCGLATLAGWLLS